MLLRQCLLLAHLHTYQAQLAAPFGRAAQVQALRQAAPGSPARLPPKQAQLKHRLAVLIPFRDRLSQLTALMAALPQYLNKQGTTHDVFVLEQVGCRLVLH